MEPFFQAQDCTPRFSSQAEGTTQAHDSIIPAGAISGQEKVQLHLYLATSSKIPQWRAVWRMGELPRSTAELLLLSGVSTPAALLFEYKRTGTLSFVKRVSLLSPVGRQTS